MATEPNAGELQILGARCAALVQHAPQNYSDAAAWLKGIRLEYRHGLGALGPIPRRLFEGFAAVLRRFNDRPSADRFHGLRRDEARRLILLGALAFDADSDGGIVGLSWTWEPKAAASAGAKPNGRTWASPMLGSQPGQERSVIEAIAVAVSLLSTERPTHQPRAAQKPRDAEVLPPVRTKKRIPEIAVNVLRVLASADHLYTREQVYGELAKMNVAQDPKTIRPHVNELISKGFIVSEPKGLRIAEPGEEYLDPRR